MSELDEIMEVLSANSNPQVLFIRPKAPGFNDYVTAEVMENFGDGWEFTEDPNDVARGRTAGEAIAKLHGQMIGGPS